MLLETLASITSCESWSLGGGGGGGGGNPVCWKERKREVEGGGGEEKAKRRRALRKEAGSINDINQQHLRPPARLRSPDRRAEAFSAVQVQVQSPVQVRVQVQSAGDARLHLSQRQTFSPPHPPIHPNPSGARAATGLLSSLADSEDASSCKSTPMNLPDGKEDGALPAEVTDVCSAPCTPPRRAPPRSQTLHSNQINNYLVLMESGGLGARGSPSLEALLRLTLDFSSFGSRLCTLVGDGGARECVFLYPPPLPPCLFVSWAA